MSKVRGRVFPIWELRAIIEGKKSQFRDAVKQKYSNTDLVWYKHHKGGEWLAERQNDVPPPRKNADGSTTHHLTWVGRVYPRYNVGDIIGVKEMWVHVTESDECDFTGYVYRETGYGLEFEMSQDEDFKWKSSASMPLESVRIYLRITGVKVEQVCNIVEEDARLEGVSVTDAATEVEKCKTAFKKLWARSRRSWEKDWVFVYTFEVVDVATREELQMKFKKIYGINNIQGVER